MKKMLLTCCLVAAANALVFGQVAHSPQSELAVKSGQLTAQLDQNNATGALATWEDISKMMAAEFTAIKQQIADAGTSNEDKKHLSVLLNKKFEIYRSLIGMRGNMIQNKDALKTKLNDFTSL